MKKTLIIFFLPLLLFSCKNNESTTTETADTAEMQRTSLANAHLLGHVKSISETPYTIDENGAIGEMDSCCVEHMEYTETGFLSKITEKNSTGEISAVGVLERMEDGKLVSRTWTEGGKEVWKRVFVRDENGKPIKALDSDTSLQVVYTHKIEKLNEYDQGTYGKSYTSDSLYWGTWSWDYTDGLVTGRSWIDSSNVQVLKRVGVVNDKGWLSNVKEVNVSEEGDTTTTLETYTYDSFDEMGNWTQCTELNDDKPVKVLKRSYTYYDK